MLDRPRLAEKAQIHPVDDGYMIYDPDQDRVHYLNVTAALVALSCDGAITAAEIACRIQQQYDLKAPPIDAVADILARLRDEGLLESASQFAN